MFINIVKKEKLSDVNNRKLDGSDLYKTFSGKTNPQDKNMTESKMNLATVT